MKAPKIKSTSSFGIGNILGLVFVLVGILLALTLIGYELPIDIPATIFQWGAALGSILGGLSMLFKKKEAVPVQAQ